MGFTEYSVEMYGFPPAWILDVHCDPDYLPTPTPYNVFLTTLLNGMILTSSRFHTPSCPKASLFTLSNTSSLVLAPIKKAEPIVLGGLESPSLIGSSSMAPLLL